MNPNAAPIPKYYRLAERLRQQIKAGTLQPGDQLPTEDQLCETYQLSRGTVRQAIRSLVDAGLIRREQGRGTFVTTPPPTSTLFTLTNFNDEVQRQNRIPTTRLLTTNLTPATPELAERLHLTVGDSVIHIVRLRLIDGQPAVHEIRYLAQTLCPTLLTEDLVNDSIHGLLVHKYQIPLLKMTHTVEIRSLSSSQSQLLQTHPETPAFFVDRLTYTTRDDRQIPAVWFQGIYLKDSYQIQATMQSLPLNGLSL